MSDAASPSQTPTAPAPALAPAEAPGPDGVGIIAYLMFIVIGGLLVFGLARTLLPSAQQHAEAPCRSLRPEPRSGAAPELALKSLDGKETSLADLRGKFVVLNFWATYCEPCIDEWPALDTLARRLEEDGRDDVVVLAVSVDDDIAKIRPFLDRMSLSDSRVQVLWDPTAKANGKFGSEAIPDTFFVSPDGDLEQAFINVRRWGRPDAFRCVRWSADEARRIGG